MKHDTAAHALAALGNPARLRLYRCLLRAGNAGLNITALQEKLEGMPRSTLVHHLGKLVVAELLVQEKVGSSLINRVNFPLMHGLIAYLQEECCIDSSDCCT